MGSRKSKRCRRGAQKVPMAATQLASGSIIEALLSAIQSTKDISPAILKKLYVLLNPLYSNPQSGIDEFQSDMEFNNDWIKVTTKDIQRLSDVLFQELSQRFKNFFDALFNDSVEKELGNEMRDAGEVVNLLLRCCLVVLTLLQEQQKVLEKGQVILGILHSLTHASFNMRKWRKGGKGIKFEKSVSVSCEYSNSDCTASTEDFVALLHFLDPADSCLPLASAMLEVFLDELLVSGQQRPLFAIFDSSAANCGMLNSMRSCQGNLEQLMEIISCHFYLTFSNKHAIEDFLCRLFWMRSKEFRCSFREIELSPTAATLLLPNPILLSAPKFMQAHVIAHISEATSNVMDLKDRKPDSRFMNCFMSLFESSVVLYKSMMERWQIDGNHKSAEGSYKSNMHGARGQLSFDCFISPDTRMKINDLITRFNGSSDSFLGNLSNKMKSDLMSSSIRFVKECQHVFDKSHEDEILSSLSYIVQRASDGFDDAQLLSIGAVDFEDLCLLASVLKLMSNSLLQIVWCLRHGDLHHLNLLRDFSSCKEYNSILRAISCFTESEIHIRIQKLLGNMMEANSTRHSESRMMFLHFSVLLSYAFSTRLDFLVKGCLLNIIALLNLFVFEEGNLYVLQLLFSPSSESIPSDFPSVNIQETMMCRRSSLIVASKIQKMRPLDLSISSLANRFTGLVDGHSQTGANALVPRTTASVLGTEEEIEESCNGELFLRCRQKNIERVSDFDDLADFIECKQGKDYSSWLKDKEKFRKWKGGKRAVFRWKRKKKTWRVVKGKKT